MDRLPRENSKLLSHPSNLSVAEAIEMQKQLAKQIIRHDDFKKLEIIAGADLSLGPGEEEACAGVILFEYPSLKEIQRVYAVAPLGMAYVPGLLSFREAPALLAAFEKLKVLPDLIFFDGQGIAHPRRLGIASHMGLLLDRPTIGCAKSVLCGRYEEPGPNRGDRSPLIHYKEVVGSALRTRSKVQPMFISLGHRISLETALDLVLKCDSGFRLPLPTRQADRFVGEIKRELQNNMRSL